MIAIKSIHRLEKRSPTHVQKQKYSKNAMETVRTVSTLRIVRRKD